MKDRKVCWPWGKGEGECVVVMEKEKRKEKNGEGRRLEGGKRREKKKIWGTCVCVEMCEREERVKE
jgi:hypothetical protein